jgi:hypothetical protein
VKTLGDLVYRDVYNKLFFHKFILENIIIKMNQIRRLIFISVTSIIILFLSSCSLLKPANPHLSKNTGNPMEPTRQISRVYPPRRDANRYLDSNRKKKKNWTKIRQAYGFDCPWDKSFTSTAERRIKCRLRRTKAKLRRQARKVK